MEMGVAEAAATLGISADSVRRRRIKEGKIKHRKDAGGRVRVLASGYEAGAAAVPPAEGSGADEVTGPRVELEHALELLAETRRRADALEKQLEAAQRDRARDAEEREQLRGLLADAQRQVGQLLPASSAADAGATWRPSGLASWWKRAIG